MSNRSALQAMDKAARKILDNTYRFAVAERKADKRTVECDDQHCPGWAPFNDCEIQRCDQCAQFTDDDEAMEEFAKVLQRALAFYFESDEDEAHEIASEITNPLLREIAGDYIDQQESARRPKKR